VDLNLDRFNLSAVVEMGTWAGTIEAPKGAENLTMDGKAFWSSLNQRASSVLRKEDRSLFADVFHPHMSDRRDEGNRFMPPPTSLTYVHRLKTLVKEEATIMQKRREHFLSTEFVMGAAGPLFPSSWSSSVEIESQAGTSSMKLVDAEITGFQDALNSAVPLFDRRAEDGSRFMVYRLGNLEVRVVQDVNGKRIGAVLSIQGLAQEGSAASALSTSDKLVKATMYVEAAPCGTLRSRYYVVFATKEGHTIVTEQLADGSITCAEDSEGLDTRNSLAKVIHSSECLGTVEGLRKLCDAQRVGPAGKLGTSASHRKRYAHAVFRQAIGDM